jgi:hypothetical protein
MRLATIFLAALATAALAAHAESPTLTKIKGDNQKAIAGPSFDSIQVRVTDREGKALQGVEVTFSCSRSPSGPCITLPQGPLKTYTVGGGIALLARGDRPDGKAFEPGVETIVATAQGATATFKVEFVPDYK